MATSNSRTIALSGGHVLIVDEADYPLAASRVWHPQQGKAGSHYAAVTRTVNGRQVKCYLHREIVGASRGQRVDHVNGNGLDNRRENLRLCSNADNMRNMRVSQARGSSRFKGVSWFVRHELWRAYIVVDYKQIHLGYFKSEHEAAEAYNAAARERFGKFARLNELR